MAAGHAVLSRFLQVGVHGALVHAHDLAEHLVLERDNLLHLSVDTLSDICTMYHNTCNINVRWGLVNIPGLKERSSNSSGPSLVCWTRTPTTMICIKKPPATMFKAVSPSCTMTHMRAPMRVQRSEQRQRLCTEKIHGQIHAEHCIHGTTSRGTIYRAPYTRRYTEGIKDTIEAGGAAARLPVTW